MDLLTLMPYVDHTVLAPTTTWQDVASAIDDAARFACAAVCVPPTFVARAAAYAHGRVPIASVIAFPFGYEQTAIKCQAARAALDDGASDVDVVINLGDVKDGRITCVADELFALRQATRGAVLKIIVETSALSLAEKRRLVALVGDSQADFIKTSTGYGREGATVEDVALFRREGRPGLGIKASGGIASAAQAARLVAAGATRLGSSRLVALAKAMTTEETHSS